MTGKLHQADRNISLLDPGGVANQIMATLDGTTMAMQQVSFGMFAAGLSPVRTATRTVATSASAWPSSPEEQAAADYLCDGVADEVEINAALASLPSSGGVVLIAGGSYTLAAPIVFGAARRILRGSGLGVTTLLALASGGTALNATLISVNGDYCELRDLTLDGNKANNAAQTSMTGVTVAAVAGALVERVRVYNSAGYGMVVQAGTNGVVRDCQIEGSAFRGAVFRAASGQPLVVSGCSVRTSTSYGVWCDAGPVNLTDCQVLNGSSYGFDIDSTSQVTLTNCLAQGNAVHGYQIEGAVTRAMVIECRSISNGACGYRSDGAQTLFLGCTAYSTTGAGIGFMTVGADCQVVGCIASDAVIGFQHNLTNRVTYVGARAIYNSNRGFDITNGSAHLQACHAFGGPGASFGIVMAGAGSNHMIDGCRILNCGSDGINVGAPIVSVQITNNFLSSNGLATNNTYKHITVAGDRIFIDQNVLRDPTSGNRPAYGIYVDGQSDNSYIGHNDTAGAGINAEISDNSTTTRRVSKLLLDYTPVADLFSGAVAATTWTDLTPNQTFTVLSPSSVIAVDVHGSVLAGITGLAQVHRLRLVFDNATARNLSGEISESNNAAYSNIMPGVNALKLTGLAVGAHTVKLQVYCTAATTAYLRPASYPAQEFLTLQVTEYSR